MHHYDINRCAANFSVCYSGAPGIVWYANTISSEITQLYMPLSNARLLVLEFS